MSNANIIMPCQCCVESPIEGTTTIYIDKNGVLRQKNDDGCEYIIYCSAE